MKFLTDFLILLFCLISPIFAGESLEYCESSVSERIHLLKNNVEVFQKNIAFDPHNSKKPITKYELYPNGWMSYGIYSDEVGIVNNDLWSMKYVDKEGDQQTLRIDAKHNKYELTHETDVVAVLSTLQVLDKNEVQKAEYIPVLEKMIEMYRSAILFHTNLKSKYVPGIEGNVTHYEVTAIGDVEFEKDFTLQISEKLSKIENFTVSGKYTCRIEDIAREMHGTFEVEYTYPLHSDEMTLIKTFTSAVM